MNKFNELYESAISEMKNLPKGFDHKKYDLIDVSYYKKDDEYVAVYEIPPNAKEPDPKEFADVTINGKTYYATASSHEDDELYITFIAESINEARKPKWWDSLFTTLVIDAYEAGTLTMNNIDEWETEQNVGRPPKPKLGAKEVLDYYLATGKDPRK